MATICVGLYHPGRAACYEALGEPLSTNFPAQCMMIVLICYVHVSSSGPQKELLSMCARKCNKTNVVYLVHIC